MSVHEPTFNDAAVPAMPILDVAPFARLAIGEASFEIGTVKPGQIEVEDETREVIAFRPDEITPWKALKNNVDQGWRPVAAEVLRNSSDALHDYVGMHMIRRSGSFNPGNMVSLTLFGFDWDLRFSSDGSRAQVRLPETNWSEVDKGLMAEFEDKRELAIAALLRFSPSIHKVFEDDVEAWALRLAAGAQVTPIM
ncbi:hypothetical protein [Thalassobius sp. MITS945101]|uniref:hypothetical protein n=1 Tax=Thalassobius sp. MITS945101 TaxID=3096994 RepID=UPI00399B5C64